MVRYEFYSPDDDYAGDVDCQCYGSWDDDNDIYDEEDW